MDTSFVGWADRNQLKLRDLGEIDMHFEILGHVVDRLAGSCWKARQGKSDGGFWDVCQPIQPVCIDFLWRNEGKGLAE